MEAQQRLLIEPETGDEPDGARLPDVSPHDLVDAEVPSVSPRNQLNDLSGREWIAETKSVWFQKGLGAKHPHAEIERLHPAPFSFQDVGRLIRFFTKEGGRVLDPFLGVGSTLKACAVWHRRGVGVELMPTWADLARLRLQREVPDAEARIAAQEIICGDVREVLASLPRCSFDFVVTSPPYWRILNKLPDHKVLSERVAHGLATSYGEDARDLGNIESYGEFLSQLVTIFASCEGVVRDGGHMAIIVGDFREKGRFVPLHADLSIRLPEVSGWMLQAVNVLVQNHKRLYPYGYPAAYVPNLHHQFVLIFKKPKAINRTPRAARSSDCLEQAEVSSAVDLEASARALASFPYQARPYCARNWGHPMHSLCSYPSKLKPGLAHFLVRLFSLPGEVVLDPFSGAGTVPFEAAIQGRRPVGIDLSPFAARLTLAKVDPPSVGEVVDAVGRLRDHLASLAAEVDVAHVEPEIREFFHPDTCQEICAAQLLLDEADVGSQRARALLWACLAHVLHGNRPYALSRRSHPIIPIPPKGEFAYKSVLDAVTAKADRLALGDLPPMFVSGTAVEADAFELDLAPASIDVLITSPPFLGTTEFLRQNRVRLWLAGMGYERQTDEKSRFLEYRRDLACYRELFAKWFGVIRSGGRLVMHLGVVRKRDMAEELMPLANEAGFVALPIVYEPAGHLENHGRTDRGATHTHEFLIAERP